MKKISNFLILGALALSLLACNKIPGMGSNAGCDDDATKELIQSTFIKNLTDAAVSDLKDMAQQNKALDLGKVRGEIKNLAISLKEIRTNNSDPNSKKNFCTGKLIVNIPSKLVKEADESRDIYNAQNVNQQAITMDMQFDNFVLNYDLDYSVQSTDDKKTIYVTLDNPDTPVEFIKSIVLDALQKSIRQNEQAMAQQEQQQRLVAEQQDAMEQQQAMSEYQQLRITEAKNNVDSANSQLNTVWGAISKDTRNELMDNQRVWLKKRDLECKLNSEGDTNEEKEVSRMNCEVNMTNNRTQELKAYAY